MSRPTSGGASIACQPWELRPGIRGYVWHASNPRAVVLLQHGYTEYAQRFVDQYNALIPRLLGAGITVYAFDMEGHGQSAGRRGVADVQEATRDHLGARRALRAGGLPVLLIGHSLGGLITASSVALDPTGLSGAIILSAALPEANAFTRAAVRALAAIAPAGPAPTSSPKPHALSRIPEVVAAAATDPLIYHGRLTNRIAASALAAANVNEELYRNWHVPTLIMHGSADRITDPSGSRKLFEAIPAEDKTLCIVEGGYHELLNDIDRDETLSVILDWLEARLAEGEE